MNEGQLHFVDDSVERAYGQQLNAPEWTRWMNEENDGPPLVLDCRNSYESEIGHFRLSSATQTVRFKDIFPSIDRIGLAENFFSDEGKWKQGNRRIMLYCTGGVRCVKVAQWLVKKKGVLLCPM